MDRRRCVAVAVPLVAVALASVAEAVVVPPQPDVVAACGHHIESGDAPLGAPRSGDVWFGRLAFTGFRSTPRGVNPPGRVGFEGREYLAWKSAALLSTGGPVTVAVAPRHRDVVLIGVTGAPGYYGAIRYQPCPPGRRAFSYDGTIGRWTGWSGGFIATHRVCAKLEIWDGERVLYRYVPLGAPCR